MSSASKSSRVRRAGSTAATRAAAWLYFKDHVDAYIVGLTLGIPGSPTTSKINTKNYTIYGQGSYDLTDKLTFQASLRYAHETKTVDFPATATGPATSSETKVHKFIPAATLNYKVDGGTIYIR